MKKIKTETVEEILKELEESKQELLNKVASKTAEYDENAKAKRNEFIANKIVPMKKEIEELEQEINKYQKIKSYLG